MSVVPRLCIEWDGLGQVSLPYGILDLPIAMSAWLHHCNSWTILAIASASMFWYARRFPPGPSFTYAWLWVGFLATITRSTDANALFYLIGFGLITGWYTTQVLQKDVWDRLLVYWLVMWPPWCVSTAVRFGDFVLHILPFAYSLQFYKHVGLHHVLQAIVFERVYFLAIENSIIGSGQAANKIYALHPPCGPQIFHSIQMLSTVGYFFAGTVCAGSGRQFLQALWLSLYVFIGFGTVGYFDSVTARFPKDKDSFMTLLSDWDEVNEKFANYLQSLKEAVSQSLGGPLLLTDNSTKDSTSSSTAPTAAMALLFSLPPPPSPPAPPMTKEDKSSNNTGTPSTAPYPPTTPCHRSPFDRWQDISEFLSYHFPPQLLTTAKEDLYCASQSTAHMCAKCQQVHSVIETKSRGTIHMGGTGGYVNEVQDLPTPCNDGHLLEKAAKADISTQGAETMQSLLDKIRSLEDVITKLKTFWAIQHQELHLFGDRSSPTAICSKEQSATGPKERAFAPRRRFPSSRRGLRRILTRKVSRLEGINSTEHPSECSTRPSSQNSQRAAYRCTSAATLDSIRSATSASSISSPTIPSSNCHQLTSECVAVEEHVEWTADTEEGATTTALDGIGCGGVLQ